jgi:hypothetical protein
MSDRERWIVYPLLMFSLFMTLRTRLLPPVRPMPEVRAERIECSNFELLGPDGQPRIRLAATAEAGQLAVYNASGKVLATLGATGRGGMLSTIDPNGMLISLGHETQVSGLFVGKLGSNRVIPLLPINAQPDDEK